MDPRSGSQEWIQIRCRPTFNLKLEKSTMNFSTKCTGQLLKLKSWISCLSMQKRNLDGIPTKALRAIFGDTISQFNNLWVGWERTYYDKVSRIVREIL